MKLSFCLVCLALPVAAAFADSPAEQAFEGLKKLEGHWIGRGVDGKVSAPVKVNFRVSAGGSALIETQFPGTSEEMVTVYHLDGPRLMLTHYCAAGNQPSMKLVEHEGNTWKFDFLSGTNMKTADMHMHSVVMTIKSADHLVTAWTAFMGGKPAGVEHFDLRRAQ